MIPTIYLCLQAVLLSRTMSFSKLSRNQLPALPTIEKRISDVQNARFDWTSVCSSEMLTFLDSHAKSIGVPKEFLFFPLLTTIASLMGTSTCIEINKKWREPALLWFVIASKKGTNKSGALNLLSGALQEIEEMLAEKDNDDDCHEEETQQQLLIDHFSFEELFNVMSRNGNKVLALYDEMTTFYGLLDLFKPNGCSHDRKTLLNLYNGGKWSRNFRSVQGKMNNTSFNIAGFIQPYYVVELLHRDDHDGFNDRQLFDVPPEIEVNYRDLETELPSHIPSFKDVLQCVIDLHDFPKTYSFGEDAMKSFIEYHDALNERKRSTIDNDIRGVLSKAKGQSARLATILHVADHCIKSASTQLNETDQLPLEVGENSMNRSTVLMNHLINVKYILCPPATSEESHGLNPINGIVENERNVENEKIRKIVTHLETSVSPSFISRKSWCLPVNGKYPVHSAIQILKKVEDLGLGTVREISHPHNSKKSKLFVKTKYDDLSDDARTFLLSLAISKEDFDASFIVSSN